MAAPHRLERKILLVIVDGLGDLPIEAFDGATPLEAAATPVLDAWVARGRCGLVDPLERGVVVETHAGTGTLMGLTGAEAAALSRGPIEAAGAKLDLRRGDVALRVNFATLEPREDALAILDRRAGRIHEGTAELVDALNAIAPPDGVALCVAPLTQHRAVLRLRGPALSDAISDTDPGAGGRPREVRASRPLRADDEAARRTAEALNRFLARAHEVLDDHAVNRERRRRNLLPANGLLTRGAGFVRAVDGLVTRLGLRGAVVTGDSTILGLARLLGFTRLTDASFTGLPATDLDAKVAAATAALRDHDVVWLHAKGTDIAAHDRKPEDKRAYIERLDAALAPLADRGLVLGVTADHTTDSNTGRHAADPVPSLVRVPDGPADAVTHFGERGCRNGGLGRLRAAAFLDALLETAGLPAMEVRRARAARES